MDAQKAKAHNPLWAWVSSDLLRDATLTKIMKNKNQYCGYKVKCK